MEFDGGKPFKGNVKDWALFVDLRSREYIFAGRNEKGQRLRSSAVRSAVPDEDGCDVTTSNSFYRLTGPQDFESARVMAEIGSGAPYKMALWSSDSVRGKPVKAHVDSWELLYNPTTGKRMLCGVVKREGGTDAKLFSSEVLGLTADHEIVTCNSRYALGQPGADYTRFISRANAGYSLRLTKELESLLNHEGNNLTPGPQHPDLGRG